MNETFTAIVGPGTLGPGHHLEPADRRRSPRFEAVERRIWLGWWIGDRFRIVAARLGDISKGGAAIVCPEAPESGAEVWFCVHGLRISAGARARVVGSERLADESGGVRVRVAFAHGCPDDVYEAALGLSAAGGAVATA